MWSGAPGSGICCLSLLFPYITTDPRQKPSGMTPIFIMAFVLFMGVVLLVATLPKQCGSISQKREKSKPSAGLIIKMLYPFFFFAKILTNLGGYTRMYPVYKNAYKRPFCPNIKTLKRRKNERVY